jgi:2-keto-4-pentenoate hydratase/2-oxohepta-3-ene-1,7-dioic acid hydratase in catechol pathway
VNITQHVTLEPGDVVSTGTPAGVGLGSGKYMKVGDVLEAEITGLGRLTVEITEER